MLPATTLQACSSRAGSTCGVTCTNGNDSHPDERTQMAQCRARTAQLQTVGAPFLTGETAERRRRHLVVSRTISGGTRLAHGTQTTLTVAARVTTWQLRGLAPVLACRQMLTSPHV